MSYQWFKNKKTISDFYKRIHACTQNTVYLSSSCSFFLSFSPSFFLSFPSVQKLYVHLSARQAVEQMSLSLFLSLSLASLSISCSLCFMWFVVCPKLELFKSHNTEPFTPGKAKEGGTKPARERINQESRWRRVCAKLQTGAAQPRHQAIDRITIHSLCSHVKY